MDFNQIACMCVLCSVSLCLLTHDGRIFYVYKTQRCIRDDEYSAFPSFLQLKRGLLPNTALPYDSHPVAHRMSRATIDSGGHTRYRGGLNGQRTSSYPTHSHG